MCSALTSDCRYDNSIMKFLGNVYCPKTMCSDILCEHKQTFQSLERSDYQSPQCSSMFQVRKFPFEEQFKLFSFCSLVKGLISLKRRKSQFKMLLQMCSVQHVHAKNVFFFRPMELQVSMTVSSAKPALTC